MRDWDRGRPTSDSVEGPLKNRSLKNQRSLCASNPPSSMFTSHATSEMQCGMCVKGWS